jgi:chemotaxis protein methyltransferase CheR
MLLSDSEFLLFQKILREESGLYFDKDKIPMLSQVLAQRLKERGCRTYLEYHDLLKFRPEGPNEIRELFDLLTIGETFFFRGAPHFDCLMRSVLPEIIGRKNAAQDKSLRLWSAGCSKGDEPYSLAIAIMEVLPSWREWSISILGTDINRGVLSYAAEAVYTKRAVEEMPPAYVEKYFKKKGSRFALNDDVKALVRFQSHNLAKDPFLQEGMQDLDIIFCRNVTIYFDFPATQRIINNLYDCLSPEGYLFIGYAETLWQVTDKFKVVEFPQAFIYKKSLSGHEQESPRPFVGVPEIQWQDTSCPAVEDNMTIDEAKVLPSQADMGHVYDEAILCFKAKKYPQALALLDEVLIRYPQDTRPYLAKANILANEGLYPEAIVELEKIIDLDNLCVESYYLLGVLKYKIGDLNEAEKQFKKVAYIDPDIVLAYYNLGNIYLYQKKYAFARRELRNAVKLLEKKPKDEKIRLCEDYTAEFLLRACRNNLEELERMSGL